MKKTFFIIGLILFFVFLAWGVSAAPFENEIQALKKQVAAIEKIILELKQSRAQPQTFGRGFFLNPCNSSGATTTRMFLSTGLATSSLNTLTCQTDFASKLDLNLIFEASTTATELSYAIEFTNDRDRRDWFCEDGRIQETTTRTVHGAQCLFRKWIPAVTSTSTRNITIDPTLALWTRIIFSNSNANGSLWAQLNRFEPTTPR